jgi:hypothetical protein
LIRDSRSQGQALLAVQTKLGKDNDPTFGHLIPLMNQVVVYTSAVLPMVKAGEAKKAVRELTMPVLVQSVAEATGTNVSQAQATDAPLESMLDCMVMMGGVMGGSTGYNPVKLVVNVLGKDHVLQMVKDLSGLMEHMPQPTADQEAAAKKMVLSVGLGYQPQEDAIMAFVDSLQPQQKMLVRHAQELVYRDVRNKMMTKDGKPTQELVDEINRQMKEMEARTGSTAAMPDLVKRLVSNDLQMQALLAVQTDQKISGRFKNFLPLVNQVVVYTTAVLPALKANKEHKKTHDLSESMFVQTVAEAAGSNPTAELEAALPSSGSLLDAMEGVGQLMAGSDGFNPVQMLVDLVGEEDLKEVLDDMMHFPLRFPDLTDKQLLTAGQMALVAGLGFGDQEAALTAFVDSLDKEQKDLINKLQKDVMDRLLGSMMLPDGSPTPRLIEEIKKEMQRMQYASGNTDAMPSDLKRLVENGAARDQLAEAQALVALHETPAVEGAFKDFLPIVRQVVVVGSVVLPGIRSRKEKKHNHDITEQMLVETLADVAKAGPEASDLEKLLPQGGDVLAALVALGNVMGGSSGYNPMGILTSVVGEDKLSRAISEIMSFPLKFPDLTDEQLVVAEEVALSAGLGFMNQEQALDKFMESLDQNQRMLINSLQHAVFENIVDSMIAEDGRPTSGLVAAIKAQMREMQARKGSTEMMPEELKNLAKAG